MATKAKIEALRLAWRVLDAASLNLYTTADIDDLTDQEARAIHKELDALAQRMYVRWSEAYMVERRA